MRVNGRCARHFLMRACESMVGAHVTFSCESMVGAHVTFSCESMVGAHVTFSCALHASKHSHARGRSARHSGPLPRAPSSLLSLLSLSPSLSVLSLTHTHTHTKTHTHTHLLSDLFWCAILWVPTCCKRPAPYFTVCET
jgi:hypothetical protein